MRKSKKKSNSKNKNIDLEINCEMENANDGQISDMLTNSDDTRCTNDSFQPKIQTFKGLGDKITIENWIKRFEIISNYFKWSDDKKIIMIGNFLEDDALNWYIENTEGINWVDLKCKMLSRFGFQKTDPIVEFFSLRYSSLLGMREYFEQKRRLGNLAKLTEEQIIPIMIEGLDRKLANYFVSIKPKTFSEFFEIGVNAEKMIEKEKIIQNKKEIFKSNISNKIRENKTDNQFVQKNSFIRKKPPNPCRVCEAQGMKNRYHWVQECRNKNNIQQNKQLNVAQENPDGFEEINKINLN